MGTSFQVEEGNMRGVKVCDRRYIGNPVPNGSYTVKLKANLPGSNRVESKTSVPDKRGLGI